MAVELACLQLDLFDIISRALRRVSLLFSYTSKITVHCTEHQDWGWTAPTAAIMLDCSMASRCGGEEIRLIVRDTELFVNREQVRASFCKTAEVCFVCIRSRSDGYW